MVLAHIVPDFYAGSGILYFLETAAENEKDDVNEAEEAVRCRQAQTKYRQIDRSAITPDVTTVTMSEKIPDDIGKRGLQRLTLFEPDSPKSVCSTLPEPSIGVIACDRIASSTQGVFHYVPDPPEDSIGVRALSKLVPKDEVPELRSAENVSKT